MNEKQRLAVIKAKSKPISCDGVIYPSARAAGVVLAPRTSFNIESKGKWILRRMKKYPHRYFYVEKPTPKIMTAPVPKPQPTYVSFAEMREMAKLKNQTNDVDK